jgi:hypothetical protein
MHQYGVVAQLSVTKTMGGFMGFGCAFGSGYSGGGVHVVVMVVSTRVALVVVDIKMVSAVTVMQKMVPAVVMMVVGGATTSSIGSDDNSGSVT